MPGSEALAWAANSGGGGKVCSVCSRTSRPPSAAAVDSVLAHLASSVAVSPTARTLANPLRPQLPARAGVFVIRGRAETLPAVRRSDGPVRSQPAWYSSPPSWWRCCCPPPPSPDRVADRVRQPAAEVRDYWTKARMRGAEPAPVAPAPVAPRRACAARRRGRRPTCRRRAPGRAAAPSSFRGRAAAPARSGGSATEVADPSAAGIRAHGRVFFTVTRRLPTRGLRCSGTAVNSRNRSVVMDRRALRLRLGARGREGQELDVRPGLPRQGRCRSASWPAKKLATTKQWKKRGNLRYDLGAAVVRRNAAASGCRRSSAPAGSASTSRASRCTRSSATRRRTGSTVSRSTAARAGTEVPTRPAPPGRSTMRIACDMAPGFERRRLDRRRDPALGDELRVHRQDRLPLRPLPLADRQEALQAGPRLIRRRSRRTATAGANPAPREPFLHPLAPAGADLTRSASVLPAAIWSAPRACGGCGSRS